MSLLVPDVGEVELQKRMMFGKVGSITGATNASPVVITSNAHGLAVNDRVTVSDVGGTTGANGTFVVSAVTTNTFTLTGTTGGGAYTSGGTWNMANMEALTLKLFKTNITPAETDVAGTYTEADFTGYSAKTLNSNVAVAAWTMPATSGGVTSTSYAQQSWSATSVQTVYGYYVVGANSTILQYAELFASSVGLINPSTLNLTPKIQLD